MLIILTSEDGINRASCQLIHLLLVQPEVLRNERVLIRETASKHSDIIGLIIISILSISSHWAYASGVGHTLRAIGQLVSLHHPK